MSIDSIVNQFLDQSGTLGAIVSVQKNGATVFAKGYGSIAVQGPAPNAGNSFQIDSLTKSFTAIAILRLWEQGTIDALTDPLGKYVDNLPNPKWAPIQLNQLLAMVSGIPDSGSATQPYTECLQSIAKLPLLFPAGSEYFYSNSNFFLLGEVINSVGGGFGVYTKEHVLDVFGMPNTGLIPYANAVDPATPYIAGKPQPWREPICGFSGGGFASTMADLETYAIGLSNGLVLKPSTYRTMWTNYPLTGGGKGEFGLGWQVVTNPDGSVRNVQKNGGGYGWGSCVVYAPVPGSSDLTGGLGVCTLINSDAKAGFLANEIYNALTAAHVPTEAPSSYQIGSYQSA